MGYGWAFQLGQNEVNIGMRELEERERSLHTLQQSTNRCYAPHLLSMLLHVAKGILISINENKLVSVQLDPTPNTEILGLVVHCSILLPDLGLGDLTSL